MSLLLIKNYIKNGLYREARRLIDNEEDIFYLMGENDNDTQITPDEDKTPLLVLLSLNRDEDNAVILSRILLEKGYYLDKRDKNGLCALNYAIALNRQKLLSLFLTSFNFELDTFRDCYKNTFLHYVFAINNKIAEIYSKYYEWDINKFKFIKNRDGLSVKDLYDFKITKQFIKVKAATSGRNFRIMSSYRPFRAGERIRTTDLSKSIQLLCLPKSFYLESNPIHICKFINQIFSNSESNTLNSDLKYVENNIKNLNLNLLNNNQTNSNSTREFKMNILHQIKSTNKIKPINTSRNTSLSDIESKINQSLPFNDDYLQNKYLYGLKNKYTNLPDLSTNRFEGNWKTDMNRIFVDYSVTTTPSYRIGSVPILKLSQSEFNLENSSENMGHSNNSDLNKLNQENEVKNKTFIQNLALVNDQANPSIHSATLHNLNHNVEIKQKNSLKDKSLKTLPKL